MEHLLLRKRFLLPLFSFIGFILLPFPAFSQGDYKYLDENGEEIILTLPEIVYTSKNPGPWIQEGSLHIPKIESHLRNDGLEHIRIITFSMSAHPMEEKSDNRITKVYIVDKDSQLIGYHSFSAWDKKAIFRTKLNGVINYIKVYVICSKHGAWMNEYTFPFRRS